MAASSSSASEKADRASKVPEWLFMQACRLEGARDSDAHPKDWHSVMGPIGERTRVEADVTGSEDWQRALRKSRMENLSAMNVNPARMLFYVAGRPVSVLKESR